jgi:voltage-gated potassium channel
VAQGDRPTPGETGRDDAPRFAAAVKPRTPLHRAWNRFINDPASARNAIILIVVADLATVLVGGAIIWGVDREEYADLPTAFWYILQTITTVGYGDVTPADPAGRAIGAAVMLLGIAFLSILTATITSSFIEARQAARRIQRDAEEAANWAALQVRLDEVMERLDRLERRDDR